jgi:hypothetical protein
MWLKSALFTTAAGTARYRIPDRALSGAVEAVELAADGLKYRPLAEIPESEAFAYESFGGQQDTPQYFVLRGDQIVLMPTPNAPLPMRVSFYLRPSVIFDSHWTTTLTNQQPANIGRVTAFNLNARTITVDVVPLDMGVIECPTAVASATQLIDVVHPGGNFEPLFIGATQTLAGSVFTITDASIDMSGIQVGDYVRAADQTDWPSVPREYHRLVCDLAGIRILRAKGDAKRADQLALATEPVLERFRSSLAPRVKSQPKIVPITTISRGRTRGWGAWS